MGIAEVGYKQTDLNQVSKWFSDVKAQDVQSTDQKRILDLFAQAGIQTTAQIEAGDNIGGLLQQVGAKMDDLVQMTKKCPAGKMPAEVQKPDAAQQQEPNAGQNDIPRE